MGDDLSELKKTVGILQKELTRLKDQDEVRKLQYKYGYYLDKCLYKEVVDLFSDSPDAYVQFLGGRYRTKAGVKRLYIGRFASRFVNGRNGPVHGFLLDHPQLQGVIDISPGNPNHAKYRGRSLMQAGVHVSQVDKIPRGLTQWWEGGIYENEYVKEDGVWKIFKLRYFPFWHGDFEHGWGYKVSGFPTIGTETYPENDTGPDEIVAVEKQMLWPDTRVVPFHYAHPVTGEEAKEEDLRAPVFGEDAKEAKPALKIEW